MQKLGASRKRKGNQAAPSKPKRSKGRAVDNDPFFQKADEALSSDEDDTQYDGRREDIEEDGFVEEETADEKRLRVAKAFLNRVKAATRGGEDDEDGEDDDEFEVGRDEKEGARDSMVAARLQQQQLEDSGRVLRKIAERVERPAAASEGRAVGRRHRQAVTCVALSDDDRLGFAASKDGLLVQWDVETNQSDKYEWLGQEASTSGSGSHAAAGEAGSGAGAAKKRGAKAGQKGKGGSRHVLALAVSSDGRYLAGGGFDRKVHLWDVRTRQHLQVADETQLVFRGHAASIDCCAFVTANDFVSGSEDGAVALWSGVKKKPVHIFRGAHGPAAAAAAASAAAKHCAHPSPQQQQQQPDEHEETEDEDEEEERPTESKSTLDEGGHAAATAAAANGHAEASRLSAPLMGGEGGAAEGWVGSVAVCRGSDLAASGAGDGYVRLWGCGGEPRRLRPLHSLPVRGFVNGLALAHSGRFLIAGTGQEPRLGRWGRISEARNGVIMHPISLRDD
eukprot:jgi/Mesen1/967/ME000012S00523